MALSLSIQTETVTSLVAVSPSSASVQLVALHDTSLPLVATVLTLTLEVSGEEIRTGRAETEALGVAASVGGPGDFHGSGPVLGRPRGRVGDGPDGGIGRARRRRDRGARGAGAVGAVRAGAGRGPGGAGSRRCGRAHGSVRAGGSARSLAGTRGAGEGGGSGLRSIPERRPAVDREDAEAPIPVGRTGVIAPAVDQIRDRRGPVSGRRTRAEVIDAAIARLVPDRAESDREETEPPTSRPRKDGPGPVAVCLAVSLLAAARGADRGRMKRSEVTDRSVELPTRRRHHVLI